MKAIDKAGYTFPFKAKVKSSGKIVIIQGGELSHDGKEWVKYQSDAEDGYELYEPNNLELVCNHVWSEEDEDMIGKVINWLKSLRPQNRWKPSDKQMNALDSTLQYGKVSRSSVEHLNSLYNDLKKLKEK